MAEPRVRRGFGAGALPGSKLRSKAGHGPIPPSTLMLLPTPGLDIPREVEPTMVQFDLSSLEDSQPRNRKKEEKYEQIDKGM
jgi:hypothetical protein